MIKTATDFITRYRVYKPNLKIKAGHKKSESVLNTIIFYKSNIVIRYHILYKNIQKITSGSLQLTDLFITQNFKSSM